MRFDGAQRSRLKTQIDFAPATVDGDGTRMTARALGPDHKIGDQPTKGAQKWNTRRDHLAASSGNKMKYVAGHLLNHHLGGPGDDMRNLAPIPSDVNDVHESHVESVIKRLVNDHGRWVYYDVKIDHGQYNITSFPWVERYPAKMTCTWAQLDSAGMMIPNTVAIKELPIQPPTAYVKRSRAIAPSSPRGWPGSCWRRTMPSATPGSSPAS